MDELCGLLRDLGPLDRDVSGPLGLGPGMMFALGEGRETVKNDHGSPGIPDAHISHTPLSPTGVTTEPITIHPVLFHPLCNSPPWDDMRERYRIN